MDVGLVDALCDYSRPVFLFGERPRPVAAHPPARDLPFEPSAPDRPICLSIHPSDADRGTSPRTHASADRVHASTSDSTDTGLTPPLEGATQDELKETARKFVEREELSHSERTCWAAVLGPARYVRLAYEDRGRPHTWCTPTPCAFLSVHC